MHQVVSVEEFCMTRDIMLKNVYTGIKDCCFDDSELVSKNNFGFLQLGQIYDCKIKLLGEVSSRDNKKAVLCRIIDRDIIIGTKHLIKVLVDCDEYYILKSCLKYSLDIDYIYFKISRKDLIQVNDIIHADYL